jgi:predicted PurR-regulated permease PerM
MGETKPRKMVGRSVAIAFGIVCIILIAGLGGAMAYYTMTINNKNTTINQLNTTTSDQINTIASLNANVTNLTNEMNQLQTWLAGNVTSYEAQISSLNAGITQLQTWLNGNETLLNQTQTDITNLQTLIVDQNNTIDQLQSSATPYETLDFGEINITSGLFHMFEIPSRNSPAFCGGFSTLSVYYMVDDVSDGNFSLTVLLDSVEWFNGIPGQGGQYGGPFTIEPLNSLNTTIDRNSQGWTSEYTQPLLIQTKAPYFVLAFDTSTDSPNWQNIWVRVHVFAYLRS